jgi:hypothetical protein
MKIKNVQSIVFLVIFFLFSNQAWAVDWIYFDTAAVGDVYYDKSSIKKVSENIISIRNKDILSDQAKRKYFSLLKEIHKAPKNPSMLNYYTKLMEIDCANKKIKDISVIFYNEKGKVIYASPKNESGEWNDILPNTVGEKLINIVSCEAVTPAVTQNEAAVPKEEPATPAADVKAKEPEASNVTVTAAPAPVETATSAAAGATAAATAASAPVETMASTTAAASAETPTSATLPASNEAPVETSAPAPTVAPASVETAASTSATAPAEATASAPTAASVETAAPVPTAASIAAPAPVETATPAVTDNNLDQVKDKQIEAKSTSEEAVRNLLTKWLDSWKSGDMKTYRSCYESNFKSEVTYANASVYYKPNVPRKSKKIDISIDKLQISADENMATAVFTQYYNSSLLKYSGKKKLELRKINDEWKIFREIM